MQNKLISNREMFRQLLARDILAIIEEWNAGTWMRLTDIKQQLHNSASAKHYNDLHTSRGWSYLCFTDRFYRAIQSINDAGYGITVRKDNNTGKLFAFSTDVLKLDNWANYIAECFSKWTVNYNR